MLQKKPRVHKMIDEHPYIGGLQSGCLFLMASWIIEEIIDAPIRMLFPDYSVPGPMGAIVALVICNLIFIRWYKPETEGLLKGGDLVSLPRFLIPMIIYWIVSVMAEVILNDTKLAFPDFAKLSLALSAAATEELAFRGAMIAPMMRNQPNRNRILMVLVVSSVVFGLMHGTNIIAGRNVSAVLMQVVAAIASGCFLGTVFLSTGNLWPAIMIHFIHDVIVFSNTGPTEGNDVIKYEITRSSWIALILIVLLAVYAFFEVRHDSSIDRILGIWREKWEIEAA